MENKIKTLKQFEDQELDLDEFLNPMDEVDEELYLHAGEIAPPQYLRGKFVQMCDADDTVNGVYHFMTFTNINNRFYYLGSLPEFKQ